MSNNKTQKKSRNKKRGVVLTKSIVERNELAEFWIAGGHCLAKNEFSEVNPFKVKSITDRKQQYTILAIACCVDMETGRNCHSTLIRPIHKRVSQEELHVEVNKALAVVCCDERDNELSGLISPAYVVVPSLEVDLESQAENFVKKFESWGAFDIDICSVGYAAREAKYA